METLWRDIKYSARTLIGAPGFTAIVVITLTLGIGVNTAIFSVVNAVLIKPLPYERSDRLVFLAERGETFGEMSVSYPNFLDWRGQQTVFENFGVYNDDSYTITTGGEPEQLRGANASADLLTALRITPAIGRIYSKDEDSPQAAPVVLLSHDLWRRRFGGDSKILNQPITLNDEMYTVIGVLPEDFFFRRPFDLWMPMGLITGRQSLQRRDNHPGLYGIARLKPDVTLERARAEMDAIADRLAKAYPASNKGNTVVVRPLKDEIVGNVARALWIILAAVGCVLLIACANIANLLLARVTTRRREMAVRLALGAGRWRITRQLLTESVILALLGALPGLALSQWAVQGLLKISPDVLPRTGEITTDVSVLLFTFGMTTVTGLLFGLIPAWQGGRTDTYVALKETARSVTGAKSRFRNALVVAEVTLTFVLLVCAGLLLRSFSQLTRVDPGFDYDRILTFAIALPEQRYAPLEPQMRFFQTLRKNILDLPGVTHAAYSSGLPLGNNGWQASFTIDGRPLPPPNDMPSMEMTLASPGYFETMKIPLRAGRWFDERDNRDHLRGRDLSQLDPTARLLAGLTSIVIDEEFARRYWPDESLDAVVGRRLRFGAGPDDPLLTILGVVGRVKMDGLREESNRVQAYVPYLQGSIPNVLVCVRTSIDPQSLAAAVRKEVQRLDPQQPIYSVNTMEQLRAATIAPDRLNLTLLGAFAGLALMLALIGLYGVISYSVTQRTQEMSVRIALGAQAQDIWRLVIVQGVKLSVIGVVIGVVVALMTARLASGLLFNVPATDPATYVAIAVLFFGVSLAACWMPARRAMKVDPMVALRHE
jgi:putative ABC transport system permease protein